MAATQQVTNGWVWQTADGDGQLCDPTRLPETEDIHEACLGAEAWGPRFARLCPVEMGAGSQGGVLLVKEKASGKSYTAPRGQVVHWLEGLFVLDAIQKQRLRVPWAEPLLSILDAERAKRSNGVLNAAAYFEQVLVGTASTGPQFLDSQGKLHRHRRVLNPSQEPPEDGPVPDGCYKINHLVSYLPPWEAFLHPNCGFYQDFYSIRWAAPHDTADFAACENSAGAAGLTWEPDECVSEDLDMWRAKAKRQWAEEQKVRQIQEAASSRPPPPKRAKHSSAAAFFADVRSPSLQHGFESLFDGSSAETAIKMGWPKRAEEYPMGYGPGLPPGFCMLGCDCMEDWHVGTSVADMHKSWIGGVSREAVAAQALEGFMARTDIVRRRGQVSNLHYLESAILDQTPGITAPQDIVSKFIAAVNRACIKAAQAIPVAALRGQDVESASILANVTRIFTLCDAEILYEPVSIGLKDGGPDWMRLDASTWRTQIDKVQPKDLKIFQTSLEMKGLEESEVVSMPIEVHFEALASGWPLVSELTTLVASHVPHLEPRLQQLVTEFLTPIYDFGAQTPVEKRLGTWTTAMFRTAKAARAAVGTHLVAP